MANLLDTIRNNSTAAATQPAGVTDQTQTVASLLRAKSGKAVGGGDIAASNLQETSAVDQTNQTLQNQVAPQAAIQQAGIEQQAMGQAQTAGIQKQEVAQNRAFNTMQNKLRTEELLAGFERDQGQLDLDRNKAQVNQFAQNLRLQNDKYVSDLQREGDRNRLNDANSFAEQYARESFDNNDELMQKKFNNISIASANDRDFQKSLAQMDIADAYSAFKAEQAANKQRAMYEGIGSITQAGIGAYGAQQSGTFSSEYKDYKDAGGTASYSGYNKGQGLIGANSGVTAKGPGEEA